MRRLETLRRAVDDLEQRVGSKGRTQWPTTFAGWVKDATIARNAHEAFERGGGSQPGWPDSEEAWRSFWATHSRAWRAWMDSVRLQQRGGDRRGPGRPGRQ